MPKHLINIYYTIGFLINPLIILAMLFWAMAILFGNALQTLTYIDYVAGVMLSWASITWIYYISKTKGIRKLTDSNVVNVKNMSGKYLDRFKLDKLISVTNITLASMLIMYGIYILFSDPINITRGGEEIIRMITIIVSLVYSLLQIQYALLVLKALKHDR